MPIHPPRSRLFSSVPFRHLAQVGHGGGRAVNVFLNVTPFVDMMTILVCFLLMVFSADGSLISAQQGLQLPDATNKGVLKKAPIIIVTRDQVTFNGEPMAEVESIQNETTMEPKILSLYDRMRQEMNEFRLNGRAALSDKEKEYCDDPKPRPKGNEVCLEGLLILQADKNTSAKVLNRVIKTAYLAEYPNIMFAVNRRDSR